MAERVEIFAPTIAAGTAIATPATFALTMNECVVRRLEVVVPPGPSGLVGIRFAHSSQVMIPFRGNAWIVTDNERLEWDLSGYPTGDKWTMLGYNTGIYSHQLQVRFFVDEIPSRPAGRLIPVEIP